jgi:hypothetical protein
METWKNYKVPTAPELFWMIPRDEDLPQEFLPLPDGISIDPSEDYLSNEDGQRVNHFYNSLKILLINRFFVVVIINGHHLENN